MKNCILFALGFAFLSSFLLFCCNSGIYLKPIPFWILWFHSSHICTWLFWCRMYAVIEARFWYGLDDTWTEKGTGDEVVCERLVASSINFSVARKSNYRLPLAHTLTAPPVTKTSLYNISTTSLERSCLYISNDGWNNISIQWKSLATESLEKRKYTVWIWRVSNGLSTQSHDWHSSPNYSILSSMHTRFYSFVPLPK